MSNNQIGEFLSALRKSKGYTQQEIAERLGVSNKTVSSWETGASCPDISMLPVLAELYEVTCDEIVRGRRLPAGEDEKSASVKRERAMERLLQRQRTNLTTVCWVSGSLTALGVLLTLLIGHAALESLIGFFIGLIFLIASVVTCGIALRYIRFSLGEVWVSEQTENLLEGLGKAMFWIVCANVAAFGFILPHASAPVHTGLSLQGLFLELLCGAIGFLLALLVGIPLYLHRRRKALQAAGAEEESDAHREQRAKALRANALAGWRYRHIALMIVLPFVLAEAVAGLLVLLHTEWNYTVTQRTYSGVWTEEELNAPSGPFLEEEYTLVSEEQPQGPIETGKYAVQYLFSEFPQSWREYYLTEDTDEGTLVTIYKYRAEISNSNEILEFYAYGAEFQGGISVLSAFEVAPSEYDILFEVMPSLPEQHELQQQMFLGDLLSWGAIIFGASGVLSLAVSIPLYLKQERAFRKKNADAIN